MKDAIIWTAIVSVIGTASLTVIIKIQDSFDNKAIANTLTILTLIIMTIVLEAISRTQR